MYSIGELRPGMAVIIDNDPYVILSAQHSKQARAGGVCRTKIKNLKSGAVIPRTFQGAEKLKPADVKHMKAQFLYSDPESFHFMTDDDFEQHELDYETVDEAKNYLVDGMKVDLLTFEGNPIAVKIPPKVELEVVKTEPGVKGDTASGGSKPAELETGLSVSVPLFIKEGDKIRVNTESGLYVERVS
jgi:elongation factor P